MTMSLRKICVVTGTRAEYGLLYWLIRGIQEDPELQLQLVVTGAHLSPEFGLTYKQIEQDGFAIDEKIEMLLSGDTAPAVTKSIGLAVIGFADALERLKPDLIIVPGDRYEILAAAQAALVANVPLAHIHGGEVSEGAIDDAIRHAVTKLAHLHFVAADPYRKRVIQLGEQPDRVFNVGAIGIDNIKKLTLMSKEELEASLSFSLGERFFVVTYHPATLESRGPDDAVKELLRALDRFPDAKIIFTKANADTNGRVINQLLEEYVTDRPDRAKVVASLGQQRYLSAIALSDAVIGNSSSGIIEVPFFRKPTINLGTRQQGRLKAASVIDCGETEEEIVESIGIALSPSFQHLLRTVVSLYGAGEASAQILSILKNTPLDGIVKKSFYDI
jgi:UDP-hydrolysing UDP-N-acetyl-D-glucosamine 2-epimerase